MKAEEFMSAAGEFPVLAALALEKNPREGVEEFIGELEDELFDADVLLALAAEAEAVKFEIADLKIKFSDANYLKAYQWSDGSIIVFLYGMDQDPYEMIALNDF